MRRAAREDAAPRRRRRRHQSSPPPSKFRKPNLTRQGWRERRAQAQQAHDPRPEELITSLWTGAAVWAVAAVLLLLVLWDAPRERLPSMGTFAFALLLALPLGGFGYLLRSRRVLVS